LSAATEAFLALVMTFSTKGLGLGQGGLDFAVLD
jgi:hypothetical protein